MSHLISDYCTNEPSVSNAVILIDPSFSHVSYERREHVVAVLVMRFAPSRRIPERLWVLST